MDTKDTRLLFPGRGLIPAPGPASIRTPILPFDMATRTKLVTGTASTYTAASEAAPKAAAAPPVVDVASRAIEVDEPVAAFMKNVEPWPTPVDGAELLSGIVSTVRDYLVVSAHCDDAMALWAVHTHAFQATSISPILALESPDKRCGKTTALNLLEELVPRPLGTASITPASLFRAVDKFGPTLLIDEGDTFIRNSLELVGILNSGHNRKNARVIRCNASDYEPELFSTWAPKAIALIGELPETLEDRSITIRLQRMLPGEKIKRFRADQVEEFVALKRKAARWAADNIDRLKAADPKIPPALHSRAADNWRALIAIADQAGGPWPERARTAAIYLSLRECEDESVKEQLLFDIRDIFDAKRADRISSSLLVDYLVMNPDRPWAEWRHGRPMTQRSLARLLKDFQIFPKTIRLDKDKTIKGYELEQFHEAFKRYLHKPDPSDPGVTPSPPSDDVALFGF
jgi:hypothetical protein